MNFGMIKIACVLFNLLAKCVPVEASYPSQVGEHKDLAHTALLLGASLVAVVAFAVSACVLRELDPTCLNSPLKGTLTRERLPDYMSTSGSDEEKRM